MIKVSKYLEGTLAKLNECLADATLGSPLLGDLGLLWDMLGEEALTKQARDLQAAIDADVHAAESFMKMALEQTDPNVRKEHEQGITDALSDAVVRERILTKLNERRGKTSDASRSGQREEGGQDKGVAAPSS